MRLEPAYLQAWRHYKKERDSHSYSAAALERVRHKVRHTKRVVAIVKELAALRSFSDRVLIVARCSALLHDIARFYQVATYGTFRDGASVNHGLKGAEIVSRCKLDSLSAAEYGAIVTAVRHHNAPAFKTLRKPLARIALGLVRDADKLDNMRWVARPEHAYGFEDLLPGPVSPGILTALAEGRVIDKRQVTTVSDLAVYVIGWMHDMRFLETRVLAVDEGLPLKLLALVQGAEDRSLLLAILQDNGWA